MDWKAALMLLVLAIGSTALAGPVPAARKIILSTDIGDDIDDAFALAFILGSPELSLDSVIVSHGSTVKRGKLAAKILSTAGRQDIPVIIGKQTGNRNTGQLRWASDFRYEKPPVGDGARAVIRRIMHSSEKVTLIPIGPLTDIADVLTIEPKVKEKIDEIILMGGSAYIGYGMRKSPDAEYNIRADVKAAQTVFESGVPIVMVGLDVTAMMQPDPADMQRLAESDKPLAQALHALFEAWEEHTPTFYDPVAAAVAFQRNLVKMEHDCVRVTDAGVTEIVPGGKPNVYVCTEVDKERFMKLFFGRILD